MSMTRGGRGRGRPGSSGGRGGGRGGGGGRREEGPPSEVVGKTAASSQQRDIERNCLLYLELLGFLEIYTCTKPKTVYLFLLFFKFKKR